MYIQYTRSGKLLRALCLLISAIILCALPLALADHPYDPVVSQQIAKGSLVMYESDSADSKKLMTLREGQIVGFENDMRTDAPWVKVHAWDEGAGKFRRGWVKNGNFETIDADGPHFRSTGEVISRTVTLRVGPSADSEKLETLNHGYTFTFVRTEGDWTYIHYPSNQTKLNQEGYVRSELIVENAEHLVCRTGDIPAYAYPSYESKMVSYLGSGTRLTIIDEVDDFWIVSLRTAAASIPKDADVYVEER